MELSNLNIKNGLCISLGANIDSKFGSPRNSLIKSKPKVEEIIKNLVKNNGEANDICQTDLKTIFQWSSLYKTSPHGIYDNQPDFINCLLLVQSNLLPSPSIRKAKHILNQLQNLEKEFGREKNLSQIWQPRCLDLDILWWDNLIINDREINLPHPRFFNRNFVISPLSEVLSKDQKIERLKESRWITD